MYVGDMVQGKSKKLNGRLINTPKEDWIIIKNTHESIVAQPMYDAVQLLRKNNKLQEATLKSKSTPYSDNLFKGKIVCGHCGYVMRYKRQNKDGIYWYRCDSQLIYGKQTCGVVSIKERDLLNVIMVMLHEQGKLMTGHYQSLVHRHTEGVEADELVATRQGIAKTKTLIQSLYENLVSDVITSEEYAQMKADYSEMVAMLTQRAGDLHETAIKRNRDIVTYKELTEAVDATLRDRKLTAVLIETLVDRVEVYSDKTVTQQIVVFCPKGVDKVGNLYPIHKGDFIGVYTRTPDTVTLIGYHVDKVLVETVITSPTDTHLIIAKP